MLRSNLLYHHYLGVEKCFVYDDGSTDGTQETLADLDFVVLRPSVGLTELDSSSERWAGQYDTHVGARQRVNIEHAVETASGQGFEWLLAFDADEFIVVDRTTPVAGALRVALNALPADIEGAVFKPLEVLQRRVEYTDVLVEETLFKRTDAKESRKTYDPFAGKEVAVPIAYGHQAGKMGVRLGANPKPKSTHRFVHADGSPLRTRTVGDLLHFYSHDSRAFIEKFRLIKDHPNRHVQGTEVALQKRLWRDVVNRAGLDAAQLRDYFAKWVMFSDGEVDRLSRRRGLPFLPSQPVLVEVTSVREALRGLDGQRVVGQPLVSS